MPINYFVDKLKKVMKKHLLIPFLALMFLATGSASAQDKGKSDEKDSFIEGHYKGDYHCYRAWRKDMKINRKQWQAEEMECWRPAYRKAWRRDMIEHEHRTDRYDHDWWGWGRWSRDYWY